MAGTVDDNLRLPHPFLGTSPCVDRGLNSLIAGAQFQLDLARATRRQASRSGGPVRVDMGAYEVAMIRKLHAALGDDIRLGVRVDGILRNVAGTDAVLMRAGEKILFDLESPRGSLNGRFGVLALDGFVGGKPPVPLPIRAIRVGFNVVFLPVGLMPTTFGGNGIPVPASLKGVSMMGQAISFDTRAPNGVAYASDGRELRFR